jgi:hypothetical protein
MSAEQAGPVSGTAPYGACPSWVRRIASPIAVATNSTVSLRCETGTGTEQDPSRPPVRGAHRRRR